ncbi:hypothetical protein AAY72_07870 [Alishewanella sp. WH16-1]|nr:hypothetical protein AAY72_07870 [Alishewanella sp. WH16-1]
MYADLHDEIRRRLLGLSVPDTNADVVILTQQQYNNLFWQLLHIQRSQRFKEPGINLVEQLNNYIAANRTSYPATFTIQAPVKLHRPPPAVSQQRVSDIHLIERLDGYFNDCLINTYGNNRLQLGRLLYSALRYGGLLRPDLLHSLMAQLISSKPMCYENLIWFELKGDAGEIHIWQPDRITVQLLNHWYGLRQSDQLLQHLDADFYIKAFVRQSQITLPNSFRLTRLVQTITALLSLHISPYSLPVLSGTQPNLTLKPPVFYRLISRKSPPLSMFDTTASEHKKKDHRLYIAPITYTAHARQYNNQMALVCIKEISSMLRQHKQGKDNSKQPRQQQHTMLAKEIAAKVKSTTCLPPVLHYLMHWASVRLTSQSRWSGKLSPGTLATYLDSIAAPLVTTFAERDLVSMGIDELTELYTQLIDEGVSLAAQTKRARILRDFHIYLEITYQMSPCYLFQQYIAKGQRMEALTVDANILMPWEYRHACDFLLHTTPQQSGLSLLQAQALMVLLMLGFRCGMRRREAHFLRLQDIEIPHTANTNKLSEFATIYITPHEQRTLKTISAERRIPIGLLLTEAESAVFADYLQARQTLGCEHSNYLFYFGEEAPLGEIGRPLASDSILFEPLTTLLQRVTGDPSFRFHHLRHSFATWMLWSWQQKPNEHQRLPIATLVDITELTHLTKAKNTLLHLSDNQPTRKVLHTISAMIGHSAPSMTLFHYIHSVSWLNWLELNRCALQISRNTEAELSNVDVRTATRARLAETPEYSPYEGMAMYATRKLKKHCIELDLSKWETTTTRQLGTLSSPVQFRVLDLDIYNALLRHVNYHVPAEICAQEANIQPHRLMQAITNANYFFEQQFHSTSKFEHKKRSRNHKRFIYSDGVRVPISPIAELPAPPASTKSLNIAMRMAREFNLLTEQEQTKILWAARYTVTSCSIVWPHFRFYDTTLLHRFINAMQVFKKAFAVIDRMRFTLVSRAPLMTEQRAAQWGKWSLDTWPTAFRDNRIDKEYAPEGYLAVDFVASKGSDISLHRKRIARGKDQVQHRRRPSEYGIRFGLYLLFMLANKNLMLPTTDNKISDELE